MPPSFFSPDTTWTGTQILLSEQHCAIRGLALPEDYLRASIFVIAVSLRTSFSLC